METIKLTYPSTINLDGVQETIAAIGFFDGIHKGHQTVISEAVKKAQNENKQSAVISFHPHPKEVLMNSSEKIRYITTNQEKANVLEKMGVDRFYIITFNKELSKLTPKEFIEQFIIRLNITELIAGFDFTFGHKGSGNMQNINEFHDNAFKTTVIEKVENGAEKVSSTRIRQLLDDGNVKEVANLLERNYTNDGIVIEGDKRGRTLGFPTANLKFPEDKYVPKQGVYAVEVIYEGKVYQGMANLGLVPTFITNKKTPSLEVYIFDFDQDIYGEEVTIVWHEFIRDEQKFNGIDEIVAQLNKDESSIRNYFKNN